MHRKQVHKSAVKLFQTAPGSAGYLGSYSAACHQVEGKLTDNQRQMYKAMAKEWSEKKLPLKLQQRYAHDNDSSRLELADFSDLV